VTLLAAEKWGGGLGQETEGEMGCKDHKGTATIQTTMQGQKVLKESCSVNGKEASFPLGEGGRRRANSQDAGGVACNLSTRKSKGGLKSLKRNEKEGPSRASVRVETQS